jgi:hypothetical protein
MLGLLSLLVLLAGIARAGWVVATGARGSGRRRSELLNDLKGPVLFIAAFAPMGAGWMVVGARLLTRSAPAVRTPSSPCPR